MNFSGLSLRDLEYVVAIADHGSFVRAAEHCRVAQPSLSAQVRKLESWIGIVIFERTTRRVLITAEGQAFIEQARRVLTEALLLFTIAQTWDDLEADERLLLEEGHCLREQALAACAAAGPSNRHGTSLETLKYMVAAGEGCTLVPALAVAPRDAVVHSPLPSPTYSRTIGLAWRRSDPRGAEFSTLADN